jgi:hypothetical protein
MQHPEEGKMKFLGVLLFFLSILLLYMGVTLSGWGILNRAGFFSMPHRLVNAWVVALFSLAVGVQAYHSMEDMRGSKVVEDQLVFRKQVGVLLTYRLSSQHGIHGYPAFSNQG